MRLAAAESELIGAMPGKDMFDRAAAHIAALPAEGSIHASAAYKRHIAETLLKRALEMACARAALMVRAA
jgi:CO/xanthine dehydrogenase FAD-binding subunit